ncbi:hypothetical protein ACOMHN_007371 [Nucella lapillus]
MRLIGLSNADTVPLIEAERPETPTAELSKSDPDTAVRGMGEMGISRKKLTRCIKILLALTLVGSIIVFVKVHSLQTVGVLNFSHFVPAVYKIEDVVKLKLSDNTLSFSDSTYGQFLKFKLTGEELNSSPDLDSCSKILDTTDAEHARKLKLGFDPFLKSVCLKWKETSLVINDTRSHSSRCFSVRWTTSKASSPENCVSMSGAHWYGGSLLREQRWPLEDVSLPMQPFIASPPNVFQSEQETGDYGPVLERMWINSRGFAIIADRDEPLHVSVNAHQKSRLCLKTQKEGDSNSNRKTPLLLSYTVCMDRTAKHVHRHVMKSLVTLPTDAPSERLMQDPVWSTRGINMNSLTQTQALTLKNDVLKYNFLHSQLHIAGNITRRVGALFLDHARFSHSNQMVSEMKAEGFPVSTTVWPLVEKGVQDYEEGAKLGVLINDSAKNRTGQWKDKTVSLINFSNPDACDWMTKRLTHLKTESFVSGFHFEMGPPSIIPLPDSNRYIRRYVQCASRMGNNSIVGMGYGSQHLPLMVDIGARHSSWGYHRGLRSIIPSVLTLGLLGYPFVTAGPVGGVPLSRVEEGRNRFVLPDEELYIRWLQLSVFLPGLEMSVGPWQYHREVIKVAHSLLKYRADHVVPVLQTAVKEFLRTGAPMIRPLWWMASDDDAVAESIDSEFLVSNQILVAPVLESGARRRDVYLPKVKDMKWKDVLHGEVYAGGQWLHGHKVNLTEVAMFVPVYKSQSDYHLRH